ncbi:MAG: ABC-type transporter, integral rane subunit, partial [Herbinix sp.]|nr:ABC-type transporter, integral rane subunit [Herbinix sp.]
MHDKRATRVNIFLIISRILVVLIVVSMFLPFFNPAKVSDLVNKNISFFTSGFNYATLANGFKRALAKEWVSAAAVQTLNLSSLIASIGIVISGIAGCLSLGEIKLKKLSTLIICVCNVVAAISLTGIYVAYQSFTLSSNLKKVEPSIPFALPTLIILLILSAIVALISYLMLEKPAKNAKFEMKQKYYLFLLMLPFIVLSFIFAYLPLWGWRYGLYSYKPGQDLTSDNFVGFKWFTYLFVNASSRSDIVRVMKNTLAMSGLGIATSWMSMAFAIFLSEVKVTRYRKVVQTMTTIPNFISWVLVYAFGFAIFATDGLVNRVLINMGLIDSGINFLLDGDNMWIKMLAWGIWKGLGWGAIIYLAAISGIDQQLYEAATVDGAGRFKRMWYITVPGLLPTYFVLLMLAIAGILNNGMEQYYVFKNAANKSTIEVLDLYVYTLGLGTGGTSNISLATVVGMLKSIISVLLLFFA